MFDFNSTEFKCSLDDTVAWCAAQPLTAHVEESPAIRHRRALVEESHRLFRQAVKRTNRSWLHARETGEWRRSMALLKEAEPDSLALLESQLRSAPLKPSFALDDFGKDVLWSEAVSEVAEKRAQLCRQVAIRQHRADEPGGRLLLVVPSETLMDGAAKYSSNGFFDVNNVPPWDI